jgi:hypothetical protein
MVCDRWPPAAENLWWKKWRELKQHVARQPDRPLLIILGSSRAEAGIQPKLLQDLLGPKGKPYLAYNFAVAATGALRELLSLHEMLDAGIRPSLVLAEYVRPLLNESHKGYIGEEFWINPGRLSYSQVCFLEPYLARADHFWRDWQLARVAPWYAYRSALHKWGKEALSVEPPDPELFPWDEWGYRSLQTASFELRRVGRAYAYKQYHASLRHFELGQGPAKAMRDLLDRCRREDIPVVLVVMPECPDFRGWYSLKGRVQLQRFLQELRDEFSVPVIDGTDWAPPAEFHDGHHLLENGAREFTLRLREELQRILAVRSS